MPLIQVKVIENVFTLSRSNRSSEASPMRWYVLKGRTCAPLRGVWSRRYAAGTGASPAIR